MKLYSVVIVLCVLCSFSLHAMSTAYAQEQTTAGGPDKIKAMLLRQAGWKLEGSSPSGSDKGSSDLVFEARGDKVVAKIVMTSRDNRSCEKEATLTSSGVKFDSCRDPQITLSFDSNDQEYPFKGNGYSGYEYKIKAK